MKVDRNEYFAAFGFAASLALALLLAVWAAGCGGSNIPFDLCGEFPGHPECIGEEPFDVCAVEGVEECAPLCDTGLAFRQGFAAGRDSVTCTVDTDTEEECNRDVPPGHLSKECRGNGQNHRR